MGYRDERYGRRYALKKGRWHVSTFEDAYRTCYLFDRFRWVYCQLVVLQGCPQSDIEQTLEKLPESLDETYARILKNITKASRDLVIRLLECLSVAIRPMRVEELAEVLALDFDGPEGVPPELKDCRQLEDRKRDVLSICSSFILLVGNDDFGVIQF